MHAHREHVGEFEIEGVDPLSAEVFRAFKTQMVLNRRLMTKMFTEQTMHPAQATCLRALGHNDGISQSDLAEILHVSRPTVTTMLQKMEASGVIERRSDSEDARLTRIYITEKGHETGRAMKKIFAEGIAASIGRMPEADRKELARLLNDLNAHVREAIDAAGDADAGTEGEPTL